MATVYAVHRTGVGRFEKLHALKIMHPHLAEDEYFVSMFLDEIRISAFIEHENVVRVIDVGEHEGLPYLIMEYLRGQPLSALLRKNDLDPRVACAIVLQACRGISAAHSATNVVGEALNVIHRDVSPQNIHVGYDGQVRIVDFGVAAGLGKSTATRTGEVKGKVAYMAPEQILQDRELDQRADVWALGVVAWESLSGRRLFSGTDGPSRMYSVLNLEIPRPKVHNDGLAQAIEACLERNVHLRLQSTAELAIAILEAFPDLNANGKQLVADHMQRHFAAEEAAVNASIKHQLDLAREPHAKLSTKPQEHPKSDNLQTPTLTTLSSSRPKTRLMMFATLGLLTTVSVGAVIFATNRTSNSETTSSTSTLEFPESSDELMPKHTAHLPPAPTTLRVGAGVIKVWVDGIEHKERPVELILPTNANLTATLVNAKGDRFDVPIDEQTKTLSLPRLEKKRRQGRRLKRKSSKKTTQMDPLLPPPPGL